MAKTIIFGLGGIGTRVIENVYKNLAESHDTLIMAIDTDAYDLEKHAVEIGMPYAMLGSDETVEHLIDRLGNPNWIEASSPILNKLNTASGSGQMRCVGRLLFEAALKSGKMMAVEERVNKLINETLTDNGGFRVLVVTSIAGGFGAGVLVPFALWLRRLFNRRGISAVRIGAYLTLPDVLFEHFSALRYDSAIMEQMYSNAYATLQEMLTLDMIKTRGCTPASKLDIDGLFDSVRNRDDGKRVLDSVFCFDSISNNGAAHESYDAYIKAVADAVCMYASPFFLSVEDNIFFEIVKSFPAFSACGVAKAVYPKDSVVKYCALRAAQEHIKRWRDEKDKCEYLSHDISYSLQAKCGDIGDYVRSALQMCDDIHSVACTCEELYTFAKDAADKAKAFESELRDYIEKLSDELCREELVVWENMLKDQELPVVHRSLMKMLEYISVHGVSETSAKRYSMLTETLGSLDPEELNRRKYYQPKRIFAAGFKVKLLNYGDDVKMSYIYYGEALLIERVLTKLSERITAMLNVVDGYYDQLDNSLHRLDDMIEQIFSDLESDYSVKYVLGRRKDMEMLFAENYDGVCELPGIIWTAVKGGEPAIDSVMVSIIEKYTRSFELSSALDMDIVKAVIKSTVPGNYEVTYEIIGNEIGQLKQDLWKLAAPLFRVPCDEPHNSTEAAFYSIGSGVGEEYITHVLDNGTEYCTDVSDAQSKYELVCMRIIGVIRYEDCERFKDGGEYHRYYRSCIERIKAKNAAGDGSEIAITPHINKDWHRILPSICLGEIPIVTETAADCEPAETDAQPIMRKITPYAGNKPYIFISYSHLDSDEVWEVIEELQKRGYRVWYDEGIDPGTEWDEFISQKVIGCGFFVAFISKHYLASNNCKDELNYARDLDKNRLLVYLENIELPSGMQMRLNRLQAVHKYKYTSREDFLEKLLQTDGLAVCRD